MSKRQFKAESKRLLDLMINSIYTHKEIFLREIISNASDAIDKLCYISLTDDKVGLNRDDFAIRISVDKDARTITVSDNGVGMTKEDMEENLGVIAHSGSYGFKKDMDEDSGDVDIIGQFGVGFYSAFMVSDKVTVISRAYGADTGARWESTGADGYTISDAQKDTAGTDIIMHVKPDSEEENYSTYLESWKLRELIKKYSDYIRWPIRMDVEHTEYKETGEKDENGNTKTEPVTTTEEQTINSMVPIWQRGISEVSDADCIAFYKEHFHDSEDPVAVIRVNAEGLTSYKALLFIPAKAPYDFYSRDFKPGLKLYSSGVMIMDSCSELLPDFFRFVRGVVDSPDLSLNISREILQHDRQLKVISGNLEKKVKSELASLMEKDPEKYDAFWHEFGRQIKYGIVGDYGMKKDLLKDLLKFHSSNTEKLTSLKDYVSRMPESQKYIYYAAGDSVRTAAGLPQNEQVKSKGYEILYFVDDVDEFVAQILYTFEEKEFKSVTGSDLGLETEEEKKEQQELSEKSQPVLDFIKDVLKDEVVNVRLSQNLVQSPVCMSYEGDISLEMEKYFRSIPGEAGQQVKAKRVLEVNASHPVFSALESSIESDKDRAEKIAKVLCTQAKLLAGIPVDDMAGYTELVCELI
ncbi:MAG: molecular chaperone HtpG [Oscillospiraceae bacterium]